MNVISPRERHPLVRYPWRIPDGDSPNQGNDFFAHYLFGFVGTAMIALWAHIAVVVPNPDATLYLRAAELFVGGEWAGGFEVYRWPFYSLLVAGMMWSTTLDALSAAQVTNFIIDFGIVASIITFARVLSRGNFVLVSTATFFAVFHPQLTEFSSLIIRDHGYVLFFLLSVTICVADTKSPSVTKKLGLGIAVMAATAFRIEGLFLGLSILFYYALIALREPSLRGFAIAGFIGLTGFLLPILFGVWVSGTLTKWMHGDFSISLDLLSDAIANRISALNTYVLFAGSNDGAHAYLSLSIGLAFFGMLRALTVPFAIIGIFAYFPQRYVSKAESLPIFWFSLSQIPMLVLFTFVSAFLAWRYAMGFALIAMFPAIYCVAESFRELRRRRPRAYVIFPLLVLTVIGTWFADIPKYHRHGHIREAATWLQQEIPSEARLWMNEPIIAYFAGRDYRRVLGVNQLMGYAPPATVDPKDVDYFVYSSIQRLGTGALPDGFIEKRKTLARFQDKEGNFVVIFQ